MPAAAASNTQTALIQSTSPAPPLSSSSSSSLPLPLPLPLSISHSLPIPTPTNLPTPYHVLIRIHAVALNPTDTKMLSNPTFAIPDGYGCGTGCDFSGIIESSGSSAVEEGFTPGTRVCGGEFPYCRRRFEDDVHDDGNNKNNNGAFAEWVVGDSRLMLKVGGGGWSDVQAAALGGIGWGTVGMCVSDPEALGLEGVPSEPAEKGGGGMPVPVLVYGGGTATGIMVVQMLKLSGYAPIAVCSPHSAPLVTKCSAVGTTSYTSPTCVESIKSLAGGVPIKHALDCITSAESAAICFGALSRAGGRYACLEECPRSWRTRRAVRVKEVMGFEMFGRDVDIGGGHAVYSRKARPEMHALGMRWAKEMQALLDKGVIRTLPIREVEGGFEGIVKGLEMLRSGEVKGEKLVVRVSE